MADAFEVTVRMYKQGLGDCFLLTFREGGKEAHVLIDCGVLLGTPDEAARMRRVAADLHRSTGGHLDVLVATHEHWDHLSGFLHARDVFEKMTVGQVWLAWTEDPLHPVARKLREKRRQTVETLRLACGHLHALGAAGRDAARRTSERISELLGFFGTPPAGTGGLGLAAAGGASTADAMQWVAERDAEIRYHRPGDAPLRLAGFERLRIYVLGPPEDEALLHRDRPRKGEAYEHADDHDTAFAVAARLRCKDEGELSPEEANELSHTQPFETRYQIGRETAREHPFFRKVYGFDDSDPDELRRRIDFDWMETAAQLALKLDSDTNNTSLALAVELLPSGRVLLFPADAQVGNWLSWMDLAWEVDGTRVAGPDLLRRTVLYKVGHHASHNATLRQGLEAMTSPELVAMIPVDEEMAKKKRWAMPFPPLFAALQEKTQGRILQADRDELKHPEGMGEARWKAFEASVAFGPPDPEGRPLYVEHTLREPEPTPRRPPSPYRAPRKAPRKRAPAAGRR